MQQSFNNISFLCGGLDTLENIESVRALPVFSEEVITFFAELSKEILNDTRAKRFPDVSSYAFFVRRASLEKQKQLYLNQNLVRIGKGISFHIAPSNVPVNFAVSMMYALLSGDSCIVRVSNKSFEQVDIICEAINRVLERDASLKNYIHIIRYEHSDEVTQKLSDLCDIRIIWGGNSTVNQIRKFILPSRSTELCFADRHSIAILNADAYLNADLKKLAKDFYIDTYWTDQNACSSPRLLVWTGNKIEEAKKVFWQEMENLVLQNYDLSQIKVVNKFDAYCCFAATHKGVSLVKSSNSCIRINLKKIEGEIMDYKGNCGFFFEYQTQNLEDIVCVLNKECQTVSYYGVDASLLADLVVKNGVKGCDRIVPIGKTMDISLVWDGVNMIDEMSRIISVI